jgi:hypothetical protein
MKHEGRADAHHLHPVALWAGVIEQKDGEEHEEETLSADN